MSWSPPVTITTEAHQVRLTPIALVRELATRYGRGRFSFDAACTQSTCVICRAGWPCTMEHPIDALSVPWLGSVWFNPPWKDVGRWVSKAAQEMARPDGPMCCVGLLPARMGSEWVQPVLRCGGRFVFPVGRVAYGGSGTSPFEASFVLVLERPLMVSDYRKTAEDEPGVMDLAQERLL